MHGKETYTNLKETQKCVKEICMKRPICVEKRPPWHVNKNFYAYKRDVDRFKRHLYMCKSDLYEETYMCGKRPPWHVNKDYNFVLEASLKSVQIKRDVDRFKRDLYMCERDLYI